MIKIRKGVLAGRDSKTLRVAGLMSGTSADGIDVAIVDISPSRLDVVAFETIAFAPTTRRDIFRLFLPKTSSVDLICRMNFSLGEAFADAVIQTCRKSRVPLKTLDLIGSHGQTIYHLPAGRGGSTLQIGESCVIAERTGVPVVADFRTRDMAAGGQGAPLVPYADWVLFSHPQHSRAVQNIGGIANVTYLKAGGTIGDVLAFDIGPGNMIIDRLAQLASNGRFKYDKDGCFAGRGKINAEMLEQLMRQSYFRRRPPKTTGRELFGAQVADQLWRKAAKAKISKHDLLATATAFTSRSIADAYRRFLGDVDEMILCGGGARNPVLVDMLRRELPGARVSAMDAHGINADAKEAISFAILAYQSWHGRCGNVPSATGARHGVVLGKIVPAQARASVRPRGFLGGHDVNL